MTETVVFRQHEIANWNRCKRKAHRLDWEALELNSREPNQRDTGNSIHAYLQWHYDPTGTVPHPPLPEDDDEQAMTAQRVFYEYLDWLEETGEDAGLTTLAVEHTLTSPVIETDYGPAMVTGRADWLVEDDLGRRIGVDHKTGRSFDKGQKLIMNSQLRTYSWLAELSGEPVRLWLHNQLRTVSRTPASKPPYFQRVEIPFSPTLIRYHGVHVLATVYEMMKALHELKEGATHHRIAPPTPQDSCSWSCDFYAVCPLVDEGREDAIMEMYHHKEEAQRKL